MSKTLVYALPQLKYLSNFILYLEGNNQQQKQQQQQFKQLA